MDGEGLGKGWGSVGEDLAKGWGRVGKGGIRVVKGGEGKGGEGWVRVG